MGFSNCAALKTSILSWLGRPGDTNVPTADFITLFEADANRKLRTHWQETHADITTVAGTDTYSLATDFLSAREVRITSTNPIRVLTYAASAVMDAEFPYATNGEPRHYTIEASSIRFGPAPDAVYTIRVEYYSKLTGLSADGDTNWLLTNFPDAYLFGTLCEAELFLGADSSDDRYQMFLQRRELSFQAIQAADRKYKTGGSPLVMRLSR